VREAIKWRLFPGFNLNARLRWRILPAFFGVNDGSMERVVLDAGCGNGMLAYQSYLRGNRVVGVSIKEGEVARCKRLFQEYLAIPDDRLSFQVRNLNEMADLGLRFDEIICTEVLEHIRHDRRVCRSFWDHLAPGGTLHLCCPNAAHPLHQRERLDESESGGHVRAGYTVESYRELLEPIGFRIEEILGLGGPVRQWWNRRIIWAGKYGPLAEMPFFLLCQPFLHMDTETPAIPYSLYVRARKPVKMASQSFADA